MCIVSGTFDQARLVPPQQWTRPAFNDFQEVIRRLTEIDRKLGQPDCHDPAKAEWMKAIEERLQKLEGGIGGGSYISTGASTGVDFVTSSGGSSSGSGASGNGLV